MQHPDFLCATMPFSAKPAQLIANLWSQELQRGSAIVVHIHDVSGREIAGTSARSGGVWMKMNRSVSMKRKSLAVIILSLLMASSLLAQDTIKSKVKTFRNGKRFTVNYDKFKDRTWVSVWFATGDTRRGGLLRGQITFEGEVPTGKVTYFFIVESYSANWRYLDESDRELYAIIDGERFRFGTGERDGNVSTGRYTRSVSVHEQISFRLDEDTFTKLANGKSVELKIGPIEFKLKDEHQEAFRDLISLAK